MTSNKKIHRAFRRVCSKVRFCYGLVWLGILLCGLVANAALFTRLKHSGISSSSLTLLGWTGLLILLLACIVGMFSSFRSKIIHPLARANMMDLFPDNRKDLEAWFAKELYTPKGDAVWKLLDHRLDEHLPKSWENRLLVAPHQTLLAVVLAGSATVGLTWVTLDSPFELSRRYFQRLVLGHDSDPLSIVSFLPERRWVSTDEELPIEVLFDRDVEGSPVMIVRSRTKFNELPMKRIGARAFKLLLPPSREDFEVTINVEKLETAPAPFAVLPAVPVRLQQLEVLDANGHPRKTILARSFPTTIHEGRRLRFTVEVTDGPWESFGFGGAKHGELKLTAIGNHAYQGELSLRESDTFSGFWLLPENAIQQSPAYTIKAIPDTPPEISIIAPVNRHYFPEVPDELTIEFKAKDDGAISEARLFVSDYLGLHVDREIPLGEENRSSVKGDIVLKAEDFENRQGRILGLTVAVRDDSINRNITYSEVVNIILPPKDLAPETQEEIREFWDEAIKRTQNLVGPAEDPREAIEELLEGGSEEELAESQNDLEDNSNNQTDDGIGNQNVADDVPAKPPAINDDGQPALDRETNDKSPVDDMIAENEAPAKEVQPPVPPAPPGEPDTQGGAQGREGGAQGGEGGAQGGEGGAQGGEGGAQGGEGGAQGGEGGAQGGEGGAPGGEGGAPGGEGGAQGDGSNENGQAATVGDAADLGGERAGDGDAPKRPDDDNLDNNQLVDLTEGSEKRGKKVVPIELDLEKKPEDTERGQETADDAPTKLIQQGPVRKIDSTKTGTGSITDAPRTPLTETEQEEAIKQHRDSLKKLTPEERQKVLEYYRVLRDLK